MPTHDLPRARRRRGLARLLRGLGAVAVIGLLGLVGLGAARAQTPAPPTVAPAVEPPTPPPSAPSGLQLLVTPYAWTPWIDGKVSPAQRPSSSGTVGFGQIWDHLTWVPFVGAAELRKERFGVVIDYLHFPLTKGLGTRNILFAGGNADLTIDLGTALFLYRAVAERDQYLDVGVGVRAWGFDGTLTLNQGLLPTLQVTRGVAWADPMLAVRYHHDLGGGFGANFSGDVGGFGAGANVDWQVMGTLDYAWKAWLDVEVGFRSLNVDYDLRRAGLELGINGPILRASIRL